MTDRQTNKKKLWQTDRINKQKNYRQMDITERMTDSKRDR